MQAALPAALPVQTCARAWKIHARFSMADHDDMIDVMATRLSHGYISNIIEKRVDYMRKTGNTMFSLDLVTYAIPRTVGRRHEAPVICFMHASHMMQLSSAQELFRIHGVTATYEPLDCGRRGTVAYNQAYHAFRTMSSKSVFSDTHLWLRVDIEGDSDDSPATIADHEDQNVAWAFNGTFVVSLHPDLFNDH